MTIGELFDTHGSDKNSFHSYGPTYDRLLGPRRAAVRDVLEVGVLGGASLWAWAEFFPDAAVVGLDLSPTSALAIPRTRILQGDSRDAASVAAALGDATFDVIVDDGDHAPTAQADTRRVLWPRLRPGGIYICEDLQYGETADEFERDGATVYRLQHERPGRWDNMLAVWAKPPEETS